MTFIDRGSGPPILVVPGVQGRWECVEPAIDALARRFRVLSFPLSGEPGASVGFEAGGLNSDVRQIGEVLDRVRLPGAVICGVSFGGVPAIRFAANHAGRTRGLVLVSTPGPGWRPEPRHQLYARAPWLFGPLFLFETPWRLGPELADALPRLGPRARSAWQQTATAIRCVSVSRMARRVRALTRLRGADVAADCARIAAPTLIVTGERHLDRVVPVEGTLEYAKLIPGADTAVIPRSGHLGLITRPEVFADLIGRFVGTKV